MRQNGAFLNAGGAKSPYGQNSARAKRVAILSLGFILFFGIFVFGLAHAQYYGGRHFRETKEGVVIQGTINEKPYEGKVYVQVEAFPKRKTRITFVQLKDPQGNIYNPSEMLTVPAGTGSGGWSSNPIKSFFGHIFSSRLAHASCGRDHGESGSEKPPEVIKRPSTESPDTTTIPTEMVSMTLCTFDVPKGTTGPFSVIVGVSLLDISGLVSPQLVIEASAPQQPALSAPPESECCKFTSITIRNSWSRRQNVEVTITSESGEAQTQIISPSDSHTFSGDLGKCVRVTVKSTDPREAHLLIEDVRVCCNELKKGKAPRFYSVNITGYTSKPCEEEEEPSKEEPPKEEPPKVEPPKKEPPVEEPPTGPSIPIGPTGPTIPLGPEGPVISKPTEPIGVTPPAIPLRIGIDITKCPYPWLPKKDNTVTFTAKIYIWVGGQGWVYPGPPRVITFKLSDVSKEKGICMNSGDETTPDLYFKDPIPGFNLSGGTGAFYDTAETQGPVTTATVTVTSDDYGSFAWIKSSAPGCEDIAPNGPVSIPLDDNTNTIADSAPQDDNGKSPRTDKDSTPTLDGHDGDGYTNYEEYRGFFVQGSHTRTDIRRKDLLINDQTAMGLGHYPTSNITCHLVANNELKDREGNFNRGHSTTGAQHGLIMRMDAGGELGEGVGGRSVQISSGQIGPPGNVSAVIFATWTARRAAHELGHSTCVRHHGEAPWAKTWIYAPEDSAVYNNRVSGWIRRKWRAAWKDPPLTLCGKTLPAQFRFHPKGAQQSGDVNCVMKYVGFFEVYSDAGMFGCWPADSDGTTFCSSPNGTGYNAGGLVGGNAARGDCRGQLRVNDK